MTESDKARFKIAMHIFEITFNSEFDNAKLAGYFMALQDIPIEAIEFAVKDAIKFEKRTPVPATIREYSDKFRKAIPQARQISDFSYKEIRTTSELGKECLANINNLFDGKIDKAEFERRGEAICQKYNVSYEETDCPY